MDTKIAIAPRLKKKATLPGIMTINGSKTQAMHDEHTPVLNATMKGTAFFYFALRSEI
jgi:hypothetical protein